MLSVLQSFYIIVLTPVSIISSKLNNRVRSIGIQIICFLLPLYMVYYYTGWKQPEIYMNLFTSHNARHLLGCAILLLLIVFSLDRKPEKVKWNGWIMIPMIFCGIWMMVISFIHPVGDGYRAFAMMLIIAYPCLYFVWNNRGDYDKLFDPLSRAISVVGALFFLTNFILHKRGNCFLNLEDV